MKILGYSQSSSKPLSLQEIDSLNKEGFNAFCIMGSDLAQPIYTNEDWADAFYQRYLDIKAIGERNNNPIKQVKVSVECDFDGFNWALTIIKKFEGCKDVIFYFDEPLNAVEAGKITRDKIRYILLNLDLIVTPKPFVVGIQKRLRKEIEGLVWVSFIQITGSSYLFANFGQPFRFVYGQFCYWHFFSSLLYPLKKCKMRKEGIDAVYLYQGDCGRITNLFNKPLRKFFLRTFKEN